MLGANEQVGIAHERKVVHKQAATKCFIKTSYLANEK